jgi:argininosuccinate synthase
MSKQKIVAAYSGGLDTSVMVKWLSEKYDAEIITFTGNLGFSKELNGLEEKAKKTGASKVYVMDLRKEFIENFAFKALAAGALYEGAYPLATAIGRPLLGKKMVEIAEMENAKIVAHGCTGKGNDQVRFEMAVQCLNPELQVLAPLRFWEFKSREEEIDYALANNIPIAITKEKPYSIDANLWGIAVECGELEDPEFAPPEDAYQITVNSKNAPNEEKIVKITFEKGIPIALNDELLSGEILVEKLNAIGASCGVGRLDIIENRVVGIKSREVYEAPAAVILHKARFELEKLTLDKETFRFKNFIGDKIANMIYEGMWFTPLFESLMAFVDKAKENISGEIKMKLYKGNCEAISRKSIFSLYNPKLATYSKEDEFDHKSAEGFLKLYCLPYKTIAKTKKQEAEIYER